MIRNGYEKLDGKYARDNGYDGIYIKGSIENPTELIIVESKQFRYTNNVADDLIEHNGVTLNAPNFRTNLPSQMSDRWIDFVSQKLRNAGKIKIADMVRDNAPIISKYVVAVDKYRREINFLKLGKYE